MPTRASGLRSIHSLILTVLLFLLAEPIFAQEVPVLEWAVGSTGNAGQFLVYGSALDANGNFFVTGFFRDNADFDPGPGTTSYASAGGRDAFIVKIDANGNFVWAKAVGAAGDDEAHSVSVDAAGNVFIVGEYQNTVDFDPGPGVANLPSVAALNGFILKLDPDGNYVWAKQVGYSIKCVDVHTSSGNVLFAGTFVGVTDLDPGSGTFSVTPSGLADMFIERMDGDGNFVWAGQQGGGSSESTNAIAVDATGNIYTTGYFGGITDFDPSPTTTYNLTAAVPGTHDTFICKLDASGNIVWAKAILRATASPGIASEPQAICVDGSGNVIASGKFVGNVYDFDPGAGTLTLVAASQDSYYTKLDVNGDLVWAKKFQGGGSIGDNNGYSIKTDAAGNLLITGGFTSIVDFDPDATTSYMTAVGNGGTAVVKLAATTGSLVWTRQIAGVSVGNPPRSYLNISAAGDIYVTGNYSGTRDFDPTPCGTFQVAGAGSQDPYFVTKLRVASDQVISSFSPTSGPVGTPVTITGTGFGPTISANGVTFTSNKAAAISAANATSITATVPSLAVTGRIRVTVNCVTVQSATNFTVTVGSIPVVSSFTPVSGPVGTPVTITGANFSTIPDNNVVSFNGTDAVVTASTATSITTSVPVGATTGKISVTVGGNTGTSAGDFTVTIPVPIIDSFTPTSGMTGAAVTITGTNFSATPADNTISFNGIDAVVIASSATSITTAVPAGATTGKISVTVGGNTAVSVDDFTVIIPPLPTITSFTPTSGPVGASVTITGTNFSTTPASNTVTFNGVNAVIGSSTATTINTWVPIGATTGKISVTIDIPGNTAISTNDFTITAPVTPTPTIISFTPTSGPAGTTVTIVGSNFSPVPGSNTVSFNGTNAVVTASTPTSITTIVPSGATSGKIFVTVNAITAISTDDFTVTVPLVPTITSLTPTSGPVSTTVTITGTDFSATPSLNTVSFNGTNAVVTASTATSITTTVPAGASTGKISVTVDGNIATSADDFTVTVPAPAISSFTPASGPIGTTVTITGTNFSTTPSGNAVAFNGTNAVVTASTATSITTTVPAGATTGKISVTVNSSMATSAAAYTVTMPAGSVVINEEPLETGIHGTITIDLVPLIATTNNNLDVSSIVVVTPPSSGATATILNGVLTINYTSVEFSGTEGITIRACDTDGNCTEELFEIQVAAGDIVVYNAVSPDGKNPIFRLEFIDIISDTRENTVYIYNRWGDEVFSVKDYNNNTNVFTGISSKGNKLPAGTYYYKVVFASGRQALTGYLDLRY